MDITASAMPGPMTQEARASTPSTPTSASTSAMGRRNRAADLARGIRLRSMARMGTFRINAMAPPSRKGARIPSSQPTAPPRAHRFCSTQ